ncbi:hypothetical protein ACIQRS_26585 [Streptomyces termitum]|nr:hypothetical protein [Streptomyces termitum]
MTCDRCGQPITGAAIEHIPDSGSGAAPTVRLHPAEADCGRPAPPS